MAYIGGCGLSKNVAKQVLNTIITAASPGIAIKQQVKVLNNKLVVRDNTVIPDLSKYSRIMVLGAGKAASQMAGACAELGLEIDQGIVITKIDHVEENDRVVCKKRNIEIVEAGHPIPCEKGVEGTNRIISLIKKYDFTETLIIWLISGGGSALTGGVGVKDYLNLAALKESMQWLLDSGAEITQVNAIRKHICLAHGGRIGLFAGKSTVVSLCVSDIIDSPLDAIAGGPTTPDSSTLQDCREILRNLSAAKPLVSALHQAFFSDNPSDLVEESPKTMPLNIIPGIILVDLTTALQAAKVFLLKTYPQVKVLQLSSHLSGEASEAGKLFAHMASGIELKSPYVILAGGETTVTMDSVISGKGGRNQHLALSAAVEMFQDPNFPNDTCLLSVGTDGTDGPTNAAGAFACKHTIPSLRAFECARSALSRYDSYTYFQTESPEDHVITGPTGTNVMDVVMICRFPNSSNMESDSAAKQQTSLL